jgi:hypothetical protein
VTVGAYPEGRSGQGHPHQRPKYDATLGCCELEQSPPLTHHEPRSNRCGISSPVTLRDPCGFQQAPPRIEPKALRTLSAPNQKWLSGSTCECQPRAGRNSRRCLGSEELSPTDLRILGEAASCILSASSRTGNSTCDKQDTSHIYYHPHCVTTSEKT